MLSPVNKVIVARGARATDALVCRGAAIVLLAACSFGISKAHAQLGPRPVCARENAPPDAAPLVSQAERLFRRVADLAEVRIAGGQTTQVDRFCVTDQGIFFGSGQLTEALTVGSPAEAIGAARIAYAIAVWRIYRLPDPRHVHPRAAREAGCTLARLGVIGDDLTTQLVELRAWTGPHADARAWSQAALEGHRACVAH